MENDALSPVRLLEVSKVTILGILKTLLMRLWVDHCLHLNLANCLMNWLKMGRWVWENGGHQLRFEVQSLLEVADLLD